MAEHDPAPITEGQWLDVVDEVGRLMYENERLKEDLDKLRTAMQFLPETEHIEAHPDVTLRGFILQFNKHSGRDDVQNSPT